MLAETGGHVQTVPAMIEAGSFKLIPVS